MWWRLYPRAFSTTCPPPRGLFQFGFSTPAELAHFVETKEQEARKQKQQLCSNEEAVPTGPGLLDAFDTLSNTVCVVFDSLQLIRSTHPSLSMMNAADRSFLKFSDFVETELNQSAELYHRLVQLKMQQLQLTPGVERAGQGTPQGLSQEQELMLDRCLEEYRANGIGFSQETRMQVAELKNAELQLQRRFMFQLGNKSSKDWILRRSEMTGISPAFLDRCCQHTTDPNTVSIPEEESCLFEVMSTADLEGVRQEAFDRCAILENEDTVLQLLQCRQKLANTLGCTSFSEVVFTSGDRLVNNPSAMVKFLWRLSDAILPLSRAELKLLDQGSGGSPIQPWNFHQLWQHERARLFGGDEITKRSPYLSLDNVLKGLWSLCGNLFGISFVRVDPANQDELWHPHVMRMDVIHRDEGLLGTLYLDLFSRDQKMSGAAQFTLLNCRQMGDGTYQNPRVALVCNFPPPRNQTHPCLLTFQEVENLFHEMGHVLHAILGRTRYQTAAGTRCSLDFLEVPSHLFQLFPEDPRVLRTFAHHFQTGEEIPEKVMDLMLCSKALGSALRLQYDIFLSLMDLQLHLEECPSSKDVLAESVEQLQASFIRQGRTSWLLGKKPHTHFSHLYHYPSSYFSYVLGQIVGPQLWDAYFVDDPFNPEAGHRLRHCLLAHGGSRPAHRILSQFLPGVGHLQTESVVRRLHAAVPPHTRPDLHTLCNPPVLSLERRTGIYCV